MTKGFYKRFLDAVRDYAESTYAPTDGCGIFHIEFDDEEGYIDAEVCVKNRYSEDERGKGFYFDKIEDISARVYDANGDETEFDKTLIAA